MSQVTFIQVIEFRTNRIDELNALMDQWVVDSEGKRTATVVRQAEDRDNPGTYLHIVEFPSYEAAMENSDRPETGAFAAKLMALCDGPPSFRNLDVSRTEML